MIVINNINDKFFTLNGVKLAKIYQPLKQGVSAIGIYNIFDSRHQLVNSIEFGEYKINGAVYKTQKEVISKLLDVVFASSVELIEELRGQLVEKIDSINFEGVLTYQTKALLEAVSPKPKEGTSAIVANDSDSSNNGSYSFSSGVWVKNSRVLDEEVLNKASIAISEKINGKIFDIFEGGNIYDYTNDVSGFFINSNTGSLNSNSTSRVSERYSVKEGDVVFIEGRVGEGGFVFYDEDENILKPLKINGLEYKYFSAVKNGKIKAPTGAKFFRFTTEFLGRTNRTNTKVSINEAYSKKRIKEEFLEVLKNNITEIDEKLEGIFTKDTNIYNFEEDMSGYYIDTNSGSLNSHSTSKVSNKYSIKEGDVVYVYRRVGEGGFVFYDEDENILKPLTVSGVEYSSFSVPLNCEVKAPMGAKFFRFTTEFVGRTNRTNTKVSINESYSGKAIKEELIKVNQGEGKRVKVVISDGFLYVSTIFSETKELVKKLNISRATGISRNDNINFVSEFLSTGLTGGNLSGESLKNSIDDICPVYLNGSYIGGNHGWRHSFVVKKLGHKKTVKDVGAIYKDSNNKEFVLLRVLNPDEIIFCSKNQSNNFKYSFIQSSGVLTYDSNGENTNDISGYTKEGVSNLYPCMLTNRKSVLLDGRRLVKEDGLYYCDFVDIKENSDIFDLGSIVNEVVSQRPSGGYSSNVYFNEIGADKLFNISNVYRCQDNGATIVYSNIRAYKKVDFGFFGAVQSYRLDGVGAVYIPKVKKVKSGSKVYDFASIVENMSLDENLILIPEDVKNPPERVVNFNDKVVLSVGYCLDRGVGKTRQSTIDMPMFISSAEKIYPKIVDNIVFNKNSFLSSVAYRGFSCPDNAPSQRTNFNYIDLSGKVYLWLDYHGKIEDAIEVRSEWIGREIKILEITSNIKILSETVNDKIFVSSSVASGSYGFACLKLV